MKKIVIFTLILVFALSFVQVSFAESGAKVSLSDNYIGHSTEYGITLNTNEIIRAGDTISIAFDDSIPIFRNTDKAKDISVNGALVSETPEFFGHRIDIISPVDVEKAGKLQIVIPRGILQNPNSPGYFVLSVKAGESEYKSNYYHITDVSTVKNVTMSRMDDGVEIIDFTTGFNGSLNGYKTEAIGAGRFTFVRPVPQDFIFIRFSHILSETFSTISRNDITVNGHNPPLNPDVKIHFDGTSEEEKEIAICVPRDINANSSVKILIKGISISDKETGTLSAKVWTSKEFTPVGSNETEIKGVYFLKTSISASPEMPDGENGFYKTSPVVTLKVGMGSGIENVETYYGFDGQNFTLYSAPLKIDDGAKTLYYYSVGYAGKRKFTEDACSMDFLVDSTSPNISVESLPTSDTPAYDLKINFSDENFDYAVVTVYGIDFTITNKNCDLPLYLFNKSTPFTVKAYDMAGNIAEFSGKILLQG